MKNKFLVLLATLAFAICANAKTTHSCFLSMDYDMETGKCWNQITDNSLIDIVMDGNKLHVGDRTYSMYNRRESNSGFMTIVHYDAIDNQNQRCKIKFTNDSSADWTTKYAIIIWYDEISNTAKWYQSREPQTR